MSETVVVMDISTLVNTINAITGMIGGVPT